MTENCLLTTAKTCFNFQILQSNLSIRRLNTNSMHRIYHLNNSFYSDLSAEKKNRSFSPGIQRWYRFRIVGSFTGINVAKWDFIIQQIHNNYEH